GDRCRLVYGGGKSCPLDRRALLAWPAAVWGMGSRGFAQHAARDRDLSAGRARGRRIKGKTPGTDAKGALADRRWCRVGRGRLSVGAAISGRQEDLDIFVRSRRWRI